MRHPPKHTKPWKMILPAATLLLSGLLLSGCGAESGRILPIASGSSSGAYYLQITPIAALWEQLDFISSCSVQATTGAMENDVLICTGQADAGLIDSFAYFAAADGTEPYTEQYTGISAIAAGAPSMMTIAVRADSGIESVADLAGHSIAVGAAGSGAEFETRFILESLGLAYSDFSRVDMVGIGPGFTSFQDGKVDAVISLMGAGNSSLMEAMTNVDIKLLALSEAEVQQVMEECEFAVEAVIPGGSYSGIDQDILTVSVPCMLAVRSDMAEDEVYQMTQAIYENLDSLKATNSNFNQWTFGPDCTGNVPLHPGAEQYYLDHGIGG